MAHSHSHTHDRSSFYMEQLCTLGVCGLLGGVAVMMYTQNKIRLVLASYLHVYVFWCGIALLGLVVLRAISLWRSVDEHDHGHGHDHDHAHDHEHDHVSPVVEHEHHHHEHEAHDHESCCDHEHAEVVGQAPDCGSAHDCGHDHAHGFNPGRYIVLLLPIVLFFLDLPNAALMARGQKIDVESGSGGRLAKNVGMRIAKDDKTGQLLIVSLARDGAAAKAGLRSGDTITEIARDTDENGNALPKREVAQGKDLSLADAAAKLGGAKDTKVLVTVTRDGGEPITAEIIRKPDVKELNFLELNTAAYTPESRKYWSGTMGRLRGQFSPGNNDRTFSLVRSKITCCAADVTSLNVVITLDPDAPGNIKGFHPNDWVQVTGEIQFRKRKDRDEYVTVMVVASSADIVGVDAEQNPYLQ